MNPCSATRCSRCKQSSTRAVRFVGRSVRISHKPLPIGRQSGMPTGHRHCARNKSLPMACRSSSVNPRSQSRTGSLPEGEQKKINGILRGGELSAILILIKYNCTFKCTSQQVGRGGNHNSRKSPHHKTRFAPSASPIPWSLIPAGCSILATPCASQGPCTHTLWHFSCNSIDRPRSADQ